MTALLRLDADVHVATHVTGADAVSTHSGCLAANSHLSVQNDAWFINFETVVNRRYGVGPGTYHLLMDLPADHPVAIIPGIGTIPDQFTVSQTLYNGVPEGGVTYAFADGVNYAHYADLQWTVTGDFGIVSLHSAHGGFLHGLDTIVYDETCAVSTAQVSHHSHVVVRPINVPDPHTAEVLLDTSTCDASHSRVEVTVTVAATSLLKFATAASSLIPTLNAIGSGQLVDANGVATAICAPAVLVYSGTQIIHAPPPPRPPPPPSPSPPPPPPPPTRRPVQLQGRLSALFRAGRAERSRVPDLESVSRARPRPRHAAARACMVRRAAAARAAAN